MIRLSDALVLASTKLRVHRVRTGVAVGISGLLFGLIAFVIIVTQGIFSSFDSFNNEGLNNQTILNITKSAPSSGFNAYENRTDAAFISEVEAAHKALVDKKKAAASKYKVAYQPELEDPSPIMYDTTAKQKVIKETALNDVTVQQVANKRLQADYVPFNINDYLKAYGSASILQPYRAVSPENGQIVYMKDGKEPVSSSTNKSQSPFDAASPTLTVLDERITQSFVTSTTFDPTKGEVPVVVPYGAAEKLLKLKPLEGSATTQQKYDRLIEVRKRIGEVTAQYCYRNTASQALLDQANAQAAEMKARQNEPGYTKPALMYGLPDAANCGPVTIVSDTRTADQKNQDANEILFKKEIGTYAGEPAQQRVTVRGVGISSDIESTGQWSVAEMIKSLFGSSLGYNEWVIPKNLLEKLPAASRPDAIFAQKSAAQTAEPSAASLYGYDSYLVSFADKGQARKLLTDTQMNIGTQGEVYALPFGSGALFVDELKNWLQSALLWILTVVGGIAIIILASLVGKTVSEGRRESAIFRAIGASRRDISGIYGMYVVLLAVRIIIFTAVMSIGIALLVELLYWKDATLGARLAFASSDTTREFHLFSLSSPYLLLIVGVILAISIIASIAPILLGARRSPIKDMRDDT